jgi:hypothetical protein
MQKTTIKVENIITRGCKWNEAETEDVTVCDY